ncbi:MAG TPA: outer membrane beta-barrel protein, partial [Planctomycetota bacterium]|nr:outer membrane beta-barrel protein [Planctomycetota bacterium]
MTRLTKMGVLGGLLSCLAVGAAWAQESTEDLKKELLAVAGPGESVRPSLTYGSAAPDLLPALVPEPTFDDNPTGSNVWLKTIKLSAFADVGYTKNFNDPRGLRPLTNPGRMFDTNSNGFLFNMGEVMLEKVASSDSPAGIRLKLGMGKDAGFLASTENLGTSAQFDIVEGYVEYLAPIGSGLDFKAGKMATLAGYEVIESKDNWSYSRSLLFTWAIPLTHTGVRATYTFMDQLNMTVGYVNGWNMIADNNNGKTFEGQLNANPTSWLNLIVNSYVGPELAPFGGANSSGSGRYVVDVCGTVSWNTWKFGVNWDSGRDEELGPPTAKDPRGSPDNWGGVAFYVKDQVVRWYAASIRAETFRDGTGGVTGFFAPGAGAPANTGFTIDNDGLTQAGKIHLWEVTFSNEFKINDNLLFR